MSVSDATLARLSLGASIVSWISLALVAAYLVTKNDTLPVPAAAVGWVGGYLLHLWTNATLHRRRAGQSKTL